MVQLIKNFVSLSGAEAASKLVTFGAFAHLARILGPEGFGYVEFTGAALLCAGLIVDQGFGPYGAREIAKAPQHTPLLVSEIVAVRFILAILAYIVMVAFAWMLDRPPIVTRLLLIYGLGLLAMPLLLQWVFQGHDQMPLVAMIQIIRQLTFAVLVLVLVRDVAHIWFVAVAELAGVCSAATYSVWTYRRRFGGILQRPLSISKRLFCEGVPIGLSQLFWMVKMFGATLILGLFASAEDVGFFAGAMRILIALHTFVWLYYFNLLPSLARAWQLGSESFARLIAHSMHGMAWTGVIGGVMWVLFAPPVMRGVYGAAFAPAGTALQWLAGVCVLAGLSGHYRFGLIAAGRQNAEMLTSALGAVIAVILIPVGYAKMGLTGATMGLLTAEVTVWGCAWCFARHMLGLRGHGKLIMRPLLAAALLAVILWLLPFLARSEQIAVSIAVLTVAAFVFDKVIRERLCQFGMLSRYWYQKLLNKKPLSSQPAQEELAP